MAFSSLGLVYLMNYGYSGIDVEGREYLFV
jgi:hypothetical protein